VETDQLVTILAFDLNPDGTLAGPVTVVRQEGVTASNRPQAGLHRKMRSVPSNLRHLFLCRPISMKHGNMCNGVLTGTCPNDDA
jgi:hypothetical protein